MNISRRFLLASVACAGAATSARADVPDTLEKVKKAGVLVIGNGGAYPPFEFVEDGKLVGFDRDLGDELAKRMGVRADWKVMEFAGLIPALTSGRVDTLITAFTWTKERAERVTFSTSYYKTGVAAAYRSGVTIVKPEDLTGKIVGVQTGTAGDKFVRDAWADKAKEVKAYPEFPLALRDLEIGRTEVVVNTLPVLRYNLAKSNKAGLRVSPVWEARDVGINTRLADTVLLAEINKHLETMHADGFLKSVDTKWFGAA